VSHVKSLFYLSLKRFCKTHNSFVSSFKTL